MVKGSAPQRNWRPEVLRYALAAALVLAAVALSATSGLASTSARFGLLYATVAVVAWQAGLGPAVLATGLGTILALFVFYPADQRLGLEANLQAAVFVMVGLILALLFENRRQRQAAWRATLDSIGDAVVVTDRHGQIIFMSRRAHTLSGWPPGGALGLSLATVLPLAADESGAPLEPPLDAAWRSGVALTLPERACLRAHNGRIIPVEGSLTPIQGDDGRLMGAVLALRDVSERRAAERAVRAGEERLRLTLNAARMALWDWDPATDVLSQSANGAEVWGAHVTTGTEALAIVHPDDRARVQDAMLALQTRGGEFNLEFRIVRPDTGALRWLEDRGSVRLDDTSQVRRLTGLVIDITERKLRDQALHLSEARLRLALRGVPVIVFNQDRDLRYTWCYDARHGHVLERLTGKTDAELLPPEEAERILAFKRQALASGRPASGEFELTWGDGKAVVELVVEPLRDDAGQVVGLTGASLDVTERKQTEHAQRRLAAAARRAAERSQGLQSVTAALASASTVPAIAETVAAHGLAALGAGAAVVLLLAADGEDLEVAYEIGWGADRLPRRLPYQPDSPAHAALRRGELLLVESQAEFAARYPGLAEQRAPSGFEAACYVPMLEKEQPLGVCMFSFRERRSFDDDDRAFLHTLARQCAQALERAHLYAAEQQARAAAEAAARVARASAARIASLQAITGALAGALTPDQVVDAVIRQGAAAVGAAAAIIHVLVPGGPDGGMLEQAGQVGYAEAAIKNYFRTPLSAATPAGDVARTGHALWFTSNAEFLARYPHLAEVRRQTGFQAFAVLPLVLDQRVLGTLAVSFVGARKFDDDDRAYMHALARQCAQALERARLYTAEQQARATAEAAHRRLALLAEISRTFIHAPDYDAMLRDLARRMLPDLADFCLIFTLDEADGLATAALAHHDPAGEACLTELVQRVRGLAADIDSPVHRVAAGIHPLLVSDLTPDLLAALPADDEVQRLARAVNARSLLVAPLRARARNLGVMVLGMAGSGRRYAAADLALAEEVAGRAALALENARLLHDVQRHNAELEERVRNRTEELNALAGALREANADLQTEVTQRRETEARIRRSERLLATAQHMARLGSWHWDLNTGLMTWSDSLYEIFGLAPSARGVTFGEFLSHIHPNDRAAVEAAVRQIVETGEPLDQDYRIVRPDGQVRTLQAHGEFVPGYAGQAGALVGVAQDISQRKRIEEELLRSQEQLRQLSGRLEAAREQERARLAREIHDELGGSLTGIKMDVARLRREHAAGNPEMDSQLEAVMRVLDATVQTVRRIATDLRPGLLDDFGVLAAIEWQLQEFQTRSGLTCVLKTEVGDDLPLTREAATGIFRLFQEALTNIARHAQASRVEVRVWQQDSQLLLSVRDNGRGIDPRKAQGTGSLGLLGMRERVHLLGGELAVIGEAGQGTTVLVKIPLGTSESQPA